MDRQVERLAHLRRDRDGEAHRRAMNDLEAASKAGRNLMPFLVEAVKADATLGEIMDLFRQVYGVYQEPVVL
jgi:methylmalonyl-CoA mutase N-terminal domain/subunit